MLLLCMLWFWALNSNIPFIDVDVGSRLFTNWGFLLPCKLLDKSVSWSLYSYIMMAPLDGSEIACSLATNDFFPLPFSFIVTLMTVPFPFSFIFPLTTSMGFNILKFSLELCNEMSVSKPWQTKYKHVFGVSPCCSLTFSYQWHHCYSFTKTHCYFVWPRVSS